MNRARIILGYIFGLICALLLSIIILLFISKKTILDKDYIIHQFDVNNYYRSVYDEINNDIKDYMVSSGFEEDIVEDLFSLEEVEIEVKTFIDSAYSGKEYIVPTEGIKTTLKGNIDKFLKSQNLKVDNPEEINSFVSDIAEYYSDEVNLFGLASPLIKYIPKLVKLVNSCLIGCSIAFVIMFIMLFVLRFKYIASVIMSSGLMLLVICLFVFNKIDIDSILIISDHFSLVLINILNYLKYLVINSGICLIVIGFIVSLIKKIEKKSTN